MEKLPATSFGAEPSSRFPYGGLQNALSVLKKQQLMLCDSESRYTHRKPGVFNEKHHYIHRLSVWLDHSLQSSDEAPF